ncbi:MAG TPA: serine/threonine-protein kinase [Gemmatimonadaceae bacterium]|nr:serine/threonine-protein kinase [Gemmatimonadaceae bacterium]
MDRTAWDRVATIFDRALDARGEERAALLDQLCGSDETIRREVEGMLDAHEQSPGLIAERRLLSREDPLNETLRDGTRVGPYRIVAPIGAGGMGDVYRAERADGAYRQTVALKVLRPGYRTAEMVRRFRIEREALARLAHPGIATILDGGALEDGRPYIVLEFVDGVPVTRYCSEQNLPLRERLTLFVRIASTVQFAHGRLVVHRDLKPSNILVQPDGTPRLLDFGIAKLLDVEADASLGVATTPDVRLLTPEYAAPEQLRGEPPSTATDVYALGVLLFEVLTSQKPFSAAGRSVSALERAIVETPAPAPSSVVHARTEWRRLRGDLDRIVLMALRKEPERRYASAAQLGEDIERFVSGRPVVARPDSVGYRLGKFVRRNRALVAGSAAAVLLLFGFGLTTAFQARRTARERDRAQRERVAAEDVVGILTGLFERADPNKHPGGDTLRVTSLLDEAEHAVAGLRDDPARQAALQRAVGEMRLARGEYARGVALLANAYELRRRRFGVDDIDAARLHHELARATWTYHGESAARPMLDSSLTELRRLLGDNSTDVIEATNDLLAVTFDSIAARPLLDRLAALDRTSPPRDPIVFAERLNTKASQALSAGRTSEAVALFRSTLDIVRRKLPPEHSDVRIVERNLAAALYGDHQFAEAEAMQRANVRFEEQLNNSRASLAMAREALALTLFAESRPDSAEVYERGALNDFREGAAPEHWRIWSAQRNLAFIVGVRGRVEEALGLLDSAIVNANSGGQDGDANVGYLTAQRVPFLLRLGRVSEASEAIDAAEQRLGASPSVTKTHRADVNRYATMVELALGHTARAVERIQSTIALTSSPKDTLGGSPLNACLLGVGLARLGRVREAQPLFQGPCSTYLSTGSPDPLIVGWVAKAR